MLTFFFLQYNNKRTYSTVASFCRTYYSMTHIAVLYLPSGLWSRNSYSPTNSAAILCLHFNILKLNQDMCIYLCQYQLHRICLCPSYSELEISVGNCLLFSLILIGSCLFSSIILYALCLYSLWYFL